MNRVTLRSGRALDADRRARADGALEALVSEGFRAGARGCSPARTAAAR